MDIVDSQLHVGPDGLSGLVAAMDALGIASVLIDEWWMTSPGNPGYANSQGGFRPVHPAAELAAWSFPGRLAYLRRLDHRDPEACALIRLARDATHCRALRVTPGLHASELAAFASGEHDALFAEASDCGLPMFVFAPGNMGTVARYAAKFADLTIVVDHCGMPPGPLMAAALATVPGNSPYPGDAADSIEAAFDHVLRLSDRPNIVLKWAHAPGMFDIAGSADVPPGGWLRRAIGAFGADRIMWASDVTANLTGESWAELLFSVRDDPGLSDADKAAVLGGTARKWLDWPDC